MIAPCASSELNLAERSVEAVTGRRKVHAAAAAARFGGGHAERADVNAWGVVICVVSINVNAMTHYKPQPLYLESNNHERVSRR